MRAWHLFMLFGVIVVWREFEVATDASRADALALGRVACRGAFVEATRQWVERFGRPSWADAPFDHEPSGAPIIRAANAPLISLCHARGLAGVAIAIGAHPVGIDAELADAPAFAAVRSDAIRTGEAQFAWPDFAATDWPARLWCAKEATVKAERTGADLLGRTLTARSTASARPDSASLDLMIRSHLGNTFRVTTSRLGAFIAATVQEKAPLPR